MSESINQSKSDAIMGDFFVLILAAVRDPSCSCDACNQLRAMADKLIAKSKEA